MKIKHFGKMEKTYVTSSKSKGKVYNNKDNFNTV